MPFQHSSPFAGQPVSDPAAGTFLVDLTRSLAGVLSESACRIAESAAAWRKRIEDQLAT